jgi:hypothetical protein
VPGPHSRVEARCDPGSRLRRLLEDLWRGLSPGL